MELFDIDPMDERPYVFHECADGIMTAHENPNLKKSKRKWIQPYKHKKKPTWLAFGSD